MSNITTKIRQRIALKKNSKFDLSCDHMTTADFFQLSPVYFKEMVPGEKISVRQSTFTRLAPMTNPVLGRMRIENRAFFVPMRLLMKGWNEFITDTPLNGNFMAVPRIDPSTIAAALASGAMSRSSSATGDVDMSNCDFWAANSDGTPNSYYRFTDVGRQAWKILQSLGYRIDLSYYVNHQAQSESEYLSPLPLLAYFKIYYDWYKSQAYNTAIFDGIFEGGSNASVSPFTVQQLVLLLSECQVVNYDKDYFSSAWDRPVAPNNGLQSSNRISDTTNTYNLHSSTARRTDVVNNASDNSSTNMSTPALRGALTDGSTTAAVGNITQYALDALKSLTDYVKRHQLAGGLAMDRMLARFGMKPTEAQLRRSVYLGKDSVNIQISDVMATASAAESQEYSSKLGEYAGKGIGFSENGFFKCESGPEYGIFMIVSSLVPKVGYVEGMSRYVLHKDRLDFFTPEFDSLGVQAIARKELKSNYGRDIQTIGGLTPAVALEGVFGYTSRYAEYKSQQDNLTGDFTCPSKSGGDWNHSWHLFRELKGQDVRVDDITHNKNFVSGNSDREQYARIFAYTGEGFDHFVIVHNFQIEDYAPMSQLFDDYEFDGGSKEVTVDINGTQLN